MSLAENKQALIDAILAVLDQPPEEEADPVETKQSSAQQLADAIEAYVTKAKVNVTIPAATTVGPTPTPPTPMVFANPVDLEGTLE